MNDKYLAWQRALRDRKTMELFERGLKHGREGLQEELLIYMQGVIDALSMVHDSNE